MDQICLVVPLLPGRTAEARDFVRDLQTGPNADYQLSEQRIGIVKEAWYLAPTSRGRSAGAAAATPVQPAGSAGRRPLTRLALLFTPVVLFARGPVARCWLLGSQRGRDE
jgi:hypothetical protein